MSIKCVNIVSLVHLISLWYSVALICHLLYSCFSLWTFDGFSFAESVINTATMKTHTAVGMTHSTWLNLSIVSSERPPHRKKLQVKTRYKGKSTLHWRKSHSITKHKIGLFINIPRLFYLLPLHFIGFYCIPFVSTHYLVRLSQIFYKK